ncbi:hypothetical protein CBR_g31047 [Chara braunii]|uniref:Uncharacterized protein n=1 Tax=Chara braunii TaxID=69332 RepID=A0A388LE94_CHABU|nr:hypothetical protein CBR_g31047 [Chara braunii]|eukprot:GBG80587.1 hypothetical protein CBR_g31047 [Chara braunii]
MSATCGDAVPARSSPIAASSHGTPYARQSADRSQCAAQGLLGVSPYSGGPEVRIGKRHRGTISHGTGGVVGSGVTPILPFAGVLGASPPGVPAVRDAAAYGGVFGGPLLPSPLLPRRMDYAATIPSTPVWSYAVAPPCPTGGASLSGDCSNAWRCRTVSLPRVVGAGAGSFAVPPQSPFVAPDSTPPVDDVDSSEAVGGTPYSGGNSIMRVCVRDACRRRLYALRDAMTGVGDHRGLVSEVIDRLLHWSLPTIRAEFGVRVASVISSSLPSRVCGRDFPLRYMPDDSGADYGQGGSQGSASGGLGESQEGSQNSFPSSPRASQRSERGRGKPRIGGRYTPTPTRPQTWWDSWEGVDQCGLGPETDRASIEEAMILWSGPTAPDVMILKPVKLLQLLAMFHLYCPWHKVSCRVSVESVSYPAQLCKLTFVCDKKCKWTWHTTLVTTNFTEKRLMEALEQRFGPGVLTSAEERMKKSDFVAVVMRKMYPYGSRSNARALETDPDGLTEYHVHEVGMWFLSACQLCREEGGDASSLYRDIMLVVDHWADDHSGCIGGKEVLCEKAGGPARLPLYSCTDTVYELVLHILGKQCSANITPYYVEFQHTSAVETFQGTIIIYAKKSVHFEKSYCACLPITVIRWNSHCWRDPVGYVARIAAGTSIRPRPSFHRHYGQEAIDSWEDRLSASMFGSARVSDWARELLRQEVCPYGAGPFPRDLFVNGGDDPVEVVDDAASGSDHEAVGENRVFIIGHMEDDVVPACDD